MTINNIVVPKEVSEVLLSRSLIVRQPGSKKFALNGDTSRAKLLTCLRSNGVNVTQRLHQAIQHGEVLRIER